MLLLGWPWDSRYNGLEPRMVMDSVRSKTDIYIVMGLYTLPLERSNFLFAIFF